MRDIEELLFERGVVVSYETIRRWCDKFGASFAHRAKAASRKPQAASRKPQARLDLASGRNVRGAAR